MAYVVSKAALEAAGYLVLPEFRPELPIAELAQELGTLADMEFGSPFSVLSPTPSVDASPVSYSGLYGLGTFPFHTDCAHWRRPPRYLVLRCVVGFREVPTLLLDGRGLIDRVGMAQLSRALVRPRRPRSGKLFLLRLYEREAESGRLRWDEKFIEASGAAGGVACREVRTAIESIAPIRIELHQPGDTLIVDNWRMLHARSPVPEHCMGRRLDRAYLGEIH